MESVQLDVHQAIGAESRHGACVTMGLKVSKQSGKVAGSIPTQREDCFWRAVARQNDPRTGLTSCALQQPCWECVADFDERFRLRHLVMECGLVFVGYVHVPCGMGRTGGGQ
eukprot:4443258-Amphidinium_carterae.1